METTSSLWPGSASRPVDDPFVLPRAGRQWLPVSAHIAERYLVTFRAPAAALAPLCPAPLTLDVRDGHAFVSVCALDLRNMGVCGAPRPLRWDSLEFLYRVAVRFRGEPSFLTLRSDVSATPLAILGRYFSHYRPRKARLQLTRDDATFSLACRSGDGDGDASIDLAPDDATAPPGSLFADAAQARAFLLDLRCSVDRRPDGRVLVQPIDHDPSGARFARVRRYRFAFLERLSRALQTPFVFDHALGLRDLHQTWGAARWA